MGIFSGLELGFSSDYHGQVKFDEATITEFISLYEEIFGERLTDTEATAIFRRLVHLYRVLLRSLPPEKP